MTLKLLRCIKHKKDAPSGTALMLAKSVAEGRNVAPDFIYGRSGETGERPQGASATLEAINAMIS